MTIRYNSTPDDIVAFNEWFYRYSEDGTRYMRRANGIILLVVIIGICAVLSVGRGVNSVSLPAVVVLLSLVFFFKPFVLFIARREAMARYRKPENANLLGEVALDVSPQEIVSVSKSATTALQWNLIRDVVVTDGYIFLRIGSHNGVVIPRHKVLSGDFEAFAAEAKRLHVEATVAASPVPLPAR